MALKSKAQKRFLFAAERRGEVPEGTAMAKVAKTQNLARLPERSPRAMALMEALRRAGRKGR